MNKFRNQAWREPEQTQFCRYIKENKVLEIIQPALTAIYQLPVKPNDLYAFFAEYLDNGAELTTQISLLRAELCFKQNELDQVEASAASKSDTGPHSRTSCSKWKSSYESQKDKISDTEVGKGESYNEVASANIQDNNEVGCQRDHLIQDYHALDPFGILFDFDMAEDKLLHATGTATVPAGGKSSKHKNQTTTTNNTDTTGLYHKMKKVGKGKKSIEHKRTTRNTRPESQVFSDLGLTFEQQQYASLVQILTR